MQMTPSEWDKAKELFEAALELDPAQRPSFFAANCNEASLQQQVEKLLLDYEAAGSFLDRPAFSSKIEDAIGLGKIQDQAEKFTNNQPAISPGLPNGQSWSQFDTDHDRERVRPFGLSATRKRESGDFRRLNLRFIRGSTSGDSLEIRDLLRSRLQIIVLIGLFANTFVNVVRFVRLDRPLFSQSWIWHIWVPAAFNLGVLAALAVVLWRKRIYTLPQLRWLETVTFGVATLYFLSDTYFPLFMDSGGYLVSYAQRHPQEIIIVSRLASMLWVVLIIGYGIFIPNTGPRCATVTVGMALSCLGVVTLGGLLHPSLPRKLLMLFLADMTLWLGIAVAMAIYGSHKITVLRQEAFAARKLGQYDLKERLGQGGMGEVYLAEHALLKRPCAIKVIRPEHADKPSTLLRFLREVQVTATLTHPNTIQIFDYGQADDGTVFYAMEYLPGLNLEKLVGQHGPLPAPRAVYVLRQLCGALREAHAVGLIHRDIKPSNVILCTRGGQYDVAKLLDFGLVRLQSADPSEGGFTQAGLIFGTPAYMSPEQALGNRELDASSDIYSLGALAWFLSTGEPPFVRDAIVQTLAAHISEPAPLLRNRRSDFPRDFAEVVQRCLAKEPDMRFPNVAALDQALSECSLNGAWTQTDAAAWWGSIPEPDQAGRGSAAPSQS